MKIRPMSIEGAWEITPIQHADERGVLLEYYRPDLLAQVTGRSVMIAQANFSVSAQGVLRGVHFADVPDGQAKYVTCPRGAILDVVVDVRLGSPTFGRWEAVVLNDDDRKAVYLSEGLGHAFYALTDNAVTAYLCSELYSPSKEHIVNALDPELAIAWPGGPTTLSHKDAAAPDLASAGAAGMLPRYEACPRLVRLVRSWRPTRTGRPPARLRRLVRGRFVRGRFGGDELHQVVGDRRHRRLLP